MLVFCVLFLVLYHTLNKIINSCNEQNDSFYYVELYIICTENARELEVKQFINCVTQLDILNQLHKLLPHYPYLFLIRYVVLKPGSNPRNYFLLIVGIINKFKIFFM